MLVQTMGGKVEGIQLICQYNIVAFQAFLLLENAYFKNGLREIRTARGVCNRFHTNAHYSYCYVGYSNTNCASVRRASLLLHPMPVYLQISFLLYGFVKEGVYINPEYASLIQLPSLTIVYFSSSIGQLKAILNNHQSAKALKSR